MQSPVRFVVRAVLMLLVAGLSLAGVAPAPQAATTYVVDDGGINCLVGGSTPYMTIQAAVTAAKPAKVHTIRVCPGSYGPVTINGFKTLKISAADPADPPVVTPTLSQTGGPIIWVDNKSTGIVLDHLILDGANFDDASTNDMQGVRITNSSVTVQNSTIRYIRRTALGFPPQGSAIQVSDYDNNGKASIIKISHNYLVDYQQQAIDMFGSIKATILNNRIDATDGGTTERTLGIGLYGTPTGTPTGKISKNVITGTSVIGIFLREVSKVSVTGNTMIGSGNGVEIISYCQSAQSNLNKVSGNLILGLVAGKNGIFIHASAMSGTSNCNPKADKNTVSGNTIAAATGGNGTGVKLEAEYLSGTFIFPQSKQTKVTKNQFIGLADTILTSSIGGGVVTVGSTSGNTTLP